MSDIKVMELYPVIVIGGGIAGLTAANYLCQANIPNILIEGGKPGGALAQSDSVTNWPGILETQGKDLVLAMKKQVHHNGTIIEKSNLIDIEVNEDFKKIKVKQIESGKEENFYCKSLILALGCNPRYLGINGEEKYWGGTRGVSNCAVCEGNLYKGKVVGVVGGGDSAIEEASYLSEIASQVHIFVRKDFFRSNDKKKTEKVINKKNVSVHFNTEVKEIFGKEEKMNEVTLYDNKNDEKESMNLDGLFYGIGSDPNTNLIGKVVELTENNFVKLYEHQETSVKGIYAVGDICDPIFKQAITSAGDGCRAALQSQKYLQEINFDYSDLDISYLRKEYPELEYSKKNIVEEKEENVKIPESLKAHLKNEKKLIKKGEVFSLKNINDLMKILDQNKMIVIDFYADWCGPCMMMKPFFHEQARQNTNVAFIQVNTDYNTDLASQLQIRSLPTILFIKNKESLFKLEGFSEHNFLVYLKQLINT